ncbi:MAG: 1-acyl-sn-glycerol-3-phosphate acyltransferase [Reichenbachiella sp.]
MIYQLLKLTVAVGLRIFFKSFSVHKPYDLPTSGPIIVVGNHPNTFMDPFILATLFKQQVGFLGNASIFVNGFVNSIFKYFGVIPIYRQQDVAPNTAPDNRKTFSACYAHLEKKKAIMLFPEGTSFHELKLRKIKTGTARIALGVEEINNFNLGVRIIPVGLYYSNPSKFRSKIYVNIGEMISVDSYKDSFLEDQNETVVSLTKAIRQSLEKLTIQTADKDQESLFFKIKRIYKSQLTDSIDPKDKKEEFRITKEISNAIQYFNVVLPEKFESIKNKIDRCDVLLNKFKTSAVKIPNIENRLLSYFKVFFGLLYSIATIPFLVYGLIQNYLPFNIPYWIANSITKLKEYHAPIMLTLGIFLFPIYYGLSYWLFNAYFELSGIEKIIYVVSLPISGYFALHYYNFYQKGIIFARTVMTYRSSKIMIMELELLRNEIINDLDEAKEIYLNRL